MVSPFQYITFLILVLAFSSLTGSFKTPPRLSGYLNHNWRILRTSEFNSQQSQISVASSAYGDMKELNNAIRLNSTMAYDLFLQQNGTIDMETVYLTLTALAQQGAYESIEDVMFKMRSQYGMNTDSMMWEIIIIESSKISSVMGKKYYNRMLKRGPLVSSIKSYEILLKALSRAENWKEISVVYSDLLLREELMPSVSTGFYEMMMSYDSKRGRWKEAQYWMSELERRNMVISHKCYRFLIDACQKGGKQKLALQYIDLMLELFKGEASFDEIDV